jgi:Asp-tRNA(Asn)/Glu-tRNA(Gln) amidotransferase A subunit family amidase
VSTGVIPACASLDCVSVFARTVAEGALVASVMARASTFPADATLTFQSALDETIWSSDAVQADAVHENFTFAVPADTMLTFEGPRGADYAAHCKAALAECVRRCADSCLPP